MKIKLNKENISKPVIKKVTAKIHKLHTPEKEIVNIDNAFDAFEHQVTKIVSKKEDIEPSTFTDSLNKLFDKFISNNKIEKMNKNCTKLAEKLVGFGNGKLAAIIYSALIKANSNNPELVEQFATNGLAIAKRFHDPVHIMARCDDLRKIYSIKSPNSEKLLRILYEEKRALNEISNNYEGAKNRFNSLSRKMKPVENYKIMLAAIKIQIAKIIKSSKPKGSIQELQESYGILTKIEKGKYTEEIEKLLSELKK